MERSVTLFQKHGTVYNSAAGQGACRPPALGLLAALAAEFPDWRPDCRVTESARAHSCYLKKQVRTENLLILAVNVLDVRILAVNFSLPLPLCKVSKSVAYTLLLRELTRSPCFLRSK